MHFWDVDREKWTFVCKDLLDQYREKGDNDKVESYQKCLERLETDAKLDLEDCALLGMDMTDSLTMNDCMKGGLQFLKKLAVTAIEKIHRKDTDSKHSADPIATPHEDKWDMYAGVVGLKGGNVTQDLTSSTNSE